MDRIILDELRWHVQILADDPGCREDCPEYIKALESALLKLESTPPGTLTETERRELIDEMNSWSIFDGNKKETRKLHEALAEIGGLDIFNPADVYSRRPKTVTIKGIRYVVG